mgnify:CR=1 FL=1
MSGGKRMTGKLKKTLCALCALALLFGCTACSESGAALTYDTIPTSSGGKDVERSAAEDDVFSLNSNSKRSFNPMIATNRSNQLICALVYENMVEIDNDFNIIKNLIIDWSSNEDYTYWTFTVDQGHTFHDGTPVTAKDLRYSLDRAVTADRFKGRFASYQGASYDEYTLYVSLGIGDSQLPKLLNIPVVQYGTYGDDYPMGSGPYMYSEDHTRLLAYEGYIGYPIEVTAEDDGGSDDALGVQVTHKEDITHPLDVIYIKEYTDAQSALDAFESSLIDVVINDPSSYTNLGYASTNEIHTYATTNMHYVVVNEAGALGRYSNFRYALNFAFDRENLVTLLHGNGVASPVAMYPTCDIYPTELANSLGYDLATCLAVLDNAGVKDYDEDGRLEYMSGSPQKVELNFVVCSDSSAKTGVVRRFAEDMDSIGITVNVSEMSWDDYMTAIEEGNYDLYYGEIRLRNDFDLTELMQVRSKDNEKSNLNYSNSTDISYEQYIKAYLAATDMERAAAYQQLAELVSLNAMLIPIGFEKQQIICHRGVVKGIDANFGNPLYNFVNWEFVED